MAPNPWRITITLQERDDGGLNLSTDAIPGFSLTASDPQAVLIGLAQTIKAMRPPPVIPQTRSPIGGRPAGVQNHR